MIFSILGDRLGDGSPRPWRPTIKVLSSLAAVTSVPAHGYIAGAHGLSTGGISILRSQAWAFVKQIAVACAIAAMIAAGTLIYTKFTAKWKESGYPTIPFAALMAVDQAAQQQGVPRVTQLNGSGNAQSPSSTQSRPGNPRQASLLDLDEYEG